MTDWLSRVAGTLAPPASDLRLVLAYYAWMFLPVIVGFALVTAAVMMVLPRQRRRDDLSGQERRVR